MRWREVPSYLRHPGLLAHRIWRLAYHLRHPDHPWLSPAAIRLLDRELTRDVKALEWGSGRSTIWLAQRVGSLLSIEHDPAWHRKVAAGLRARGLTRAECRLVPVPESAEERAHEYWLDSPYTRVVEDFEDASLGLALVDGLYRQTCALRVLPKVAPGGLLVIDNARAVPALGDWRVPPGWELICWDERRYLDTAVWRKPPEPV